VADFIGAGRFDSGAASSWADGDFNYDGVTDILDIAGFVSSGLYNADPYNPPTRSIAAVPEPGPWTMTLAGLVGGVAATITSFRRGHRR